MNDQQQLNFDRIAKAIKYINDNVKKQPSLNEIAEFANLSPFHFQRLFTEWAGVSPKKFIQFISVNYAKELLRGKKMTLFDTADQIGLSGTGRLHDLFVKIEGMTPGEYKNGGEHLKIEYSFLPTPFGHVIIASTVKGICHLAFIDDEEKGTNGLFQRFPNAQYSRNKNQSHLKVSSIFSRSFSVQETLSLHLAGTPFQLKVWEALLHIPLGEVSTYGSLAGKIGNPKASRAVGTAIGSNPIAFLVPCHRVIQSTGQIGGYMWDPIRKRAILGWEAAKINL